VVGAIAAIVQQDEPQDALVTLSRDYLLLAFGTLAWGLFVVIETIGLSPRFPEFHTLSYLASQHTWLKVVFAVALSLTGPLFWIHASRVIGK
jgi:hypothetical protein